MKQKTFDLTEPQLARLALEADRSGQGQAEIVRAALEMLFASRFTPYPTSTATSQPTSTAVGTSTATSGLVPPPDQPIAGHQHGHQQGSAPVRARVEESLFPTTHEEEPKEKQGGSREGAKKRKEMPAPPAEIAAVVELWLAYKRDRGESYRSAAGLKELYNKLSEWGPERAFAAVKHSMASNWAGVFEANGGGNGRTREPDIRRTAGAHKEPQIIVNYSRYEPPGEGA